MNRGIFQRITYIPRDPRLSSPAATGAGNPSPGAILAFASDARDDCLPLMYRSTYVQLQPALQDDDSAVQP